MLYRRNNFNNLFNLLFIVHNNLLLWECNNLSLCLVLHIPKVRLLRRVEVVESQYVMNVQINRNIELIMFLFVVNVIYN